MPELQHIQSLYQNMRFLLILFLGFYPVFVSAQQDVNVFYEPKGTGYIMYADNNLFCPVSISLDLDMQNLNFTGRDRRVFVIPARSYKFRLGSLRVSDHRLANRFLFRYNVTYGDIERKVYDTAYEYDLPYQKGEKFLLYQGYNGTFSHQNQHALDFAMPEGTPVVAAREGIVFKVVQKNNISCNEQACGQFNNYISIYHADGTIAYYAHIRYQGAVVKEGDIVKKGDMIAYSGNTGWSSGPHLHFCCFLPNFGDRKTVMTKFKIADGFPAGYLDEKQIYTRNY